MKHLILPIASSPYEGAHQSSIIVDLEKAGHAAALPGCFMSGRPETVEPSAPTVAGSPSNPRHH